MSDEPAAGGDVRLLATRTFTVEVRTRGDRDDVTTTRVVHLETQDADGWPGWSGARLLDFIQARIGVTEPQPGQPAEAAAVPSEPAESTHRPASAMHRYDLLTAAGAVLAQGPVSARLRLDPSELDLPAGHAAVAQVELYGEPAGAGRAEVLATRTIDLAVDHPVEAVLGGQLPDREPPFTIFAVVRVLVEPPAGRPARGLGGATLGLAVDAQEGAARG